MFQVKVERNYYNFVSFGDHDFIVSVDMIYRQLFSASIDIHILFLTFDISKASFPSNNFSLTILFSLIIRISIPIELWLHRLLAFLYWNQKQTVFLILRSNVFKS